jgi:RHS repeat-associated protein
MATMGDSLVFATRRMMQPTMTRAMVVVVGCLAMTVPAWAQAPPATIEYYHLDGVGSVRAVTNQSGQLVRRHDFFPFGEGDGVVQGNDPLRFTGKERDAETGLDYFSARYYASRTGRFTTVDPVIPIEDALLDPQRWNRYSYVMNRPLVLTDPDGRCPSCFMLLQRIASSPTVQRVSTWTQTQGVAAWNWATRFFNSPTGQETVQTLAELATGGQAPAGLLPALTSTTKAAFLETALAEGRGGVSAAGRALQSHASRAGSWLADLAHGGNAAENTKAAKGILEMILERGQTTFGNHPTFGNVIRVRLPDGSGAWWKENGEFIGYLERYTPKQ